MKDLVLRGEFVQTGVYDATMRFLDREKHQRECIGPCNTHKIVRPIEMKERTRHLEESMRKEKKMI